MNNECDGCGAPNGSKVIRSGDQWLRLGDDFFYYTPDGARLRQSEVPEAFDDSKPVKVELSIVMDGSTPRCLCGECAKHKPKPNVQQTNFFYLLQDVTR